MSYICEADETYCRAGARSRRNLSDKCHFNAKQINFSVGYGIYDVPDACFIIPFSAKQKNHIVGEGCSPLGRRHEVTEGEASPPRNAPAATLHKIPCDKRSRKRFDYYSHIQSRLWIGFGGSKPPPYEVYLQ